MTIKVIFIVASLTLSANGYACKCGYPDSSDYLANCKNVYIATLTNLTRPKATNNPHSVSGDSALIGSISEAKNFAKGSVQSVTSIYTVLQGSSCDSLLYVGQDYLVCDNGEPSVQVMQCGYTAPMSLNHSKIIFSILKK